MTIVENYPNNVRHIPPESFRTSKGMERPNDGVKRLSEQQSENVEQSGSNIRQNVRNGYVFFIIIKLFNPNRKHINDNSRELSK